MLDFDNDGELDLALIDEITDAVILVKIAQEQVPLEPFAYMPAL